MFLYLGWRRFSPAKSVAVIPGVRRYHACDITPHFFVRSPLIMSGWYLLDVQLEHGFSAAPSLLQVDYGDGFAPGAVFDLALPNNTRVKRICYFEHCPKSIRFDPIDADGEFVVHRFTLTRVPFVVAKPSIFRWLSRYQTEFMNKSISEIKQIVAAEAKKLGIKPVTVLRKYFAGRVDALRRKAGYSQWIKAHTPTPAALQEQVSELLVADNPLPRFSVLVPVYNSPINFLRACIESVLQQVYPHWQLCLVDDASSNCEIKQCLMAYAERDSRIQVIFRETNGHIVEASNSALARASGDYLALLDHDDTLAPHALLRMAEAIAANPKARLVYSDEDKIDVNDSRSSPHFKPDWNPDLLLGQNYICHLTVLQTGLVRQVGGFRPGTEGSQDHDLLLRCMPYLTSDTVVHVPDVLYHWRMIEGSTAASAEGKDYTETAGLKAVKDYLQTHHPKAKAMKGRVPNSYRVIWPLPETAPKVSLLIPTRNSVEILKPCVDAILHQTDYHNFEILILDNQSECSDTLAYFEAVSQDSRVTVHSWDHPFNFSAINNFGAHLATGEILALVNNDVEPIHGDWLRELVSHVCRPEIGCVGAKLYYPNDTLQHAGVILGIGGVAGHSHKYFPKDSFGYFSRLTLVQNLSAVTGACLLVRKAVYEQVGGLNEQNLTVAFNDVDFCLKVREAGYRNLWTPHAELYHHESVSRGAEDTQEKRDRFMREVRFMRDRWGEQLDADPAYNPNLSLIQEDFSITE